MVKKITSKSYHECIQSLVKVVLLKYLCPEKSPGDVLMQRSGVQPEILSTNLKNKAASPGLNKRFLFSLNNFLQNSFYSYLK